MATASTLAFEPEKTGLAAPGISAQTSGAILIIPFLACVYALIVFPLLIVSCSPTDEQCLFESRPENRIVWPTLAAIAIIFFLNRRSKLTFPPHMVWLFAYLALAGASVAWAFNPGLSLVRFVQQTMIVLSITIPALIAAERSDLMRILFLSFALAVLINLYFVSVLVRAPITIENATWGYPGYFAGKNYLGECAGLAFVISIYEIIRRRGWRVSGIIVAIVSAWLLYWSNSKTSLALAALAPFLALVVLILRKTTRASPIVLPLVVITLYAFVTTVTNFQIGRLSYYITGEPTFTGRMFIWQFANYEIGMRPLLGWGYQSFWLAGPSAPSLVDGPGWIMPWVRTMPNAHNGYLDTMLETGYVGFALLVMMILSCLHSFGPIVDRDPRKGWLLISLSFFVLISNGLETTWVRGFEFVWIVFLFVAAEAARPSAVGYPGDVPEQQASVAHKRTRGTTHIKLNKREHRPSESATQLSWTIPFGGSGRLRLNSGSHAAIPLKGPRQIVLTRSVPCPIAPVVPMVGIRLGGSR